MTERTIAGRRCLVCRRAIRLDSTRAEYLFLRPGDVEVWVCGPKCLARWEDDDSGEFDFPSDAKAEEVVG